MGKSADDRDRMDEAALRAAALRYLARYAASSEQVARVLMRRLARQGPLEPGEAAAAADRVRAVVAALARAGLIDDAAYAAMKADTLDRRGASTRWILAALRDKGVPDALAAEALAGLGEEGAERERRAVLRHAQRRRLGPWSDPQRREGRRLRDIAALARAGFAPALAAWAVDLSREEAEDALAASSAA